MKAKYLIVITAIIGVALYSCVKDEVFQGPPIISNVTLSPQVPNVGEDVTVTAKVVDLNGVEEVKLYFRVGTGTFESVTMTAAGDIYSGEIPGQTAGTLVAYYVEATNILDKKAVSPLGAPATTAAFTVGAALIVMNEVQPRGTTGADADWVEIYNGSDNPVNISGYKIYDSGGQSGSKAKMTFQNGTIIPAKGFFVIVVDDAATANPAGSNFGLSSGGEQVWLENADGFIIDTFTFLSTPDASHTYGRKPDGSSTFVFFTQITKGSSNNNATSVNP
ncbi:MAG: lamin tail domain-containing protein [Bacteroidetes bacterium]|nr:lamin tail domain-containing protein [Bacteroidota bacterium]